MSATGKRKEPQQAMTFMPTCTRPRLHPLSSVQQQDQQSHLQGTFLLDAIAEGGKVDVPHSPSNSEQSPADLLTEHKEQLSQNLR